MKMKNLTNMFTIGENIKSVGLLCKWSERVGGGRRKKTHTHTARVVVVVRNPLRVNNSGIKKTFPCMAAVCVYFSKTMQDLILHHVPQHDFIDDVCLLD